MMQDNKKTGTVLEIIRMSTEDGPGIRTTVFFKGCTLKCSWCHNPESLSPVPQVQWIGNNCIGCRICEKACPAGALELKPEGMAIDRDLCRGCGTCADQCPSTAMELLGKKWNVAALTDELVKDKAYFERSRGGVTLSGGEAAMQKEFCLSLLKELKGRGIQTALDTCGHISWAVLESLLPYIDILLFDLKEIDTAKHTVFTGAGNETILENARNIAAYMKDHIRPATLWVRTPVIPGTTATHENIRGIGNFITINMRDSVDRWELCSFNNLCRDKYQRLGMDWQFADKDLLTARFMEELAETARSSVPVPSIVRWSGSTILEKNTDTNSPADVEKKIKSSLPRC
ncbi:MAG: glycyl-radical enzyme activating protein [Spirochaetae bacterium HGW-Spirochaetae-1]|nr:MAG: glycyl-radical enzyme activating protein [Spirochaetae bacterium HGW-Spirochaetae-1]